MALSTVMPGGATLQNAINVNYGQLSDASNVMEYLRTYVKSDIGDLLPRGKQVIYSIQDFYQAVQFATLYEGSISSQRIQEYTSTLVTRLQALQDGLQGKILTKTAFNSIDDYVAHILGTNQVVNVDVSLMDDASAEVVTKVLAKLLFDFLKRKEQKADMPIKE